jgi:hypothetical protein
MKNEPYLEDNTMIPPRQLSEILAANLFAAVQEFGACVMESTKTQGNRRLAQGSAKREWNAAASVLRLIFGRDATKDEINKLVPGG